MAVCEAWDLNRHTLRFHEDYDRLFDFLFTSHLSHTPRTAMAPGQFKATLRILSSEFLATLLLIFIGCGTVTAAAQAGLGACMHPCRCH